MMNLYTLENQYNSILPISKPAYFIKWNGTRISSPTQYNGFIIFLFHLAYLSSYTPIVEYTRSFTSSLVMTFLFTMFSNMSYGVFLPSIRNVPTSASLTYIDIIFAFLATSFRNSGMSDSLYSLYSAMNSSNLEMRKLYSVRCISIPLTFEIRGAAFFAESQPTGCFVGELD